jgi:hypothetical protein
MFEKHLLESGKIDVARARGRVQKPDAIASDGRRSGRPWLRKKASDSRYKYASPHAPFPEGGNVGRPPAASQPDGRRAALNELDGLRLEVEAVAALDEIVS